MKVLINALSTAPGGSLTHLLGLLDGFRQVGFAPNVSIVASYPDTVHALEARGWNPITTRVKDPLKRAFWEAHSLPHLIQFTNADLLYSSNFMSLGATCPQIVYHQNAHVFAPFRQTTDPNRKTRFLIQKIAGRYTLKAADASVFVSRFLRGMAEKVSSATNDRFSVIPYGLGGVYVQTLNHTWAFNLPSFRLAAVQAPLHHKDNETLLRAFKALLDARPDLPWVLYIAGWLDWSEWKERARELGVGERIVWCGFLNEQAVADLLSGSDALLFTSTFESFGLPIIEAMACGCPVIATNTSAIPEVAGGAAVLVPPKSPESISQAILLLLEKQELRRDLILRGKRRARDFSWLKAAEEHICLFERMLTRTRQKELS
ncbi:MAG TPA: glycosyltransferase family 1 protein [Rhodothermales bacterium]|nr:glycosyltransferase family 1 protein [Rhodothermales bacterium]